jgi:hypothetical protein
MLSRVCVTSASTAVPRIGKKRIKCSGGGSTVMSLMRSSSVWLVFSTLAYQVSLAEVALAFIAGFLLKISDNFRESVQTIKIKTGKKKPPGVRRFLEICCVT